MTRQIHIDDSELDWQFVRASGPGGQHVNKTATAVQLRFNVAHSPSLSDEVRQRLTRLASNRINHQGELVIDARRYRSQERNRHDAIKRLIELIRKAAEPPTPRRKTKPSRAAKQRRLEEKRRRGETKQRRRKISDE